MLAILFVATGVNHFVSPVVYLKIKPEYLPWPLAFVYFSGFFEVLGGGRLGGSTTASSGWVGIDRLARRGNPGEHDTLINADQFPAIPA